MNTLVIVAAVFALRVSSASQTAGGAIEHQFWTPLEQFDAKRDPAKDLQRAIKEARVSKKRILLEVGGEWCIWCHRLDTLFMKNPDLSQFLHSGFVVVKVHYDNKTNRNERFLSRYPKISGYPHLFVLEKNGTLLHSQDTGELEEGKGHSKNKVMVFLRTWAPKRR